MDELKSLASLHLTISEPDSAESYEDTVKGIAGIVENMLNENPDLLFSYLYRLDVDEAKIKFAMSPLAEAAPHIGLARLIIDRQLQRMRTRQEYSAKGKE